MAGIRLSDRHQRWIYGVGLVLVLTGFAWIVARLFLVKETPFGSSPSDVESWSLKIHGGAAMAFLIILGTLIQGHMQGGWRAGKNVRTGVSLVAFNLLLILTGYGLYYLGSETLRPISSWIHIVTGVIVPPLLVIHVKRRPRT